MKKVVFQHPKIQKKIIRLNLKIKCVNDFFKRRFHECDSLFISLGGKPLKVTTHS